MVELNTLLLVGIVSCVAGVVMTVVIGLLVGIFLNTRKGGTKEEEKEDQAGFMMPMPFGRITQAEVEQAKAEMAKNHGVDKGQGPPQTNAYL